MIGLEMGADSADTGRCCLLRSRDWSYFRCLKTPWRWRAGRPGPRNIPS